MNIRVAIRVRPFNEREKNLNTSLCVSMKSNQTFLLDKSGQVKRTFTFDHCFWSHDGFSTDERGYHSPADDSYHD